MELAQRLKKSRTDKKISQQELAKMAKVHYTNVGRYERGDAKPSAEVLNKLAMALDVSPDFLMNGTLEDKAREGLTDDILLNQFKKIEQMPSNKKQLLVEFLDAFIFKSTLQQQLAE